LPSFISSETNEYSSIRFGGIASIDREAEGQSGPYPRSDCVSRDHNDKNVRRRELGDHHVPVKSRYGVCRNRAIPLTGERAPHLPHGTKTAYRLEASNCSVPLQRLETIGPMLIRDVAVDFALARAP
jgi:hypothetical protein